MLPVSKCKREVSVQQTSDESYQLQFPTVCCFSALFCPSLKAIKWCSQMSQLEQVRFHISPGFCFYFDLMYKCPLDAGNFTKYSYGFLGESLSFPQEIENGLLCWLAKVIFKVSSNLNDSVTSSVFRTHTEGSTVQQLWLHNCIFS